ncbi:MAG: PEP-utilizing enzyme [Acidobacteriota bacterium]|nr:PEP-utilizing enzyme [Acidobacteriota bacterium]
MGKYEYLKVLAEPSRGIPVPAFAEASQIVAADQAFVRALVGDGPYAVRSSCDGEDAFGTAHAGRYVSVIGVPFEELPSAIEAVRQSYGPDAGKVIVQQAIEPVVSGVAFSSSPEGFLGETVVTFGRGLGEDVVSDVSETVTYHISDDGSCTWTSGAAASLAALGLDCASLAAHIRHLCTRCAEAIGAEADIEFAVDGTSQVWVVQARPITRIAGMVQSEALGSQELLDSSNIVESYPGIVLPLTQSFASEMYRRIFTAAVDRLTGSRKMSDLLAKDLRDMLVFSDWHAYYRLASWYAVLSLIPFSGLIKRAWRSSLGVEHVAGDRGPQASVPPSAKRAVIKSFLRYLKASPDEVDTICDRIRPVLDEARRTVDVTDDAQTLLRVIETLRDEVLSCWDITLFNDVYTFVWTFLAGGRARRVATTRRELDSLRPVRAMRTLVGRARKSGTTSEEYAAARETFLSAYGDRAPGELKLETRTWRSDPASLDAYVMSRVDGEQAGTSGGAGSHEHDDGQGQRGGLAMRCALRGIAMRERSRLMRTEMFGIVRSAYDRIGTALERRSVIERAEDVYYLTTQEVADALHCSSDQRGEDLRETVCSRRLREESLAAAPSPKTLRVCGPRPWDHSAGSLGAQCHALSWRESGVAGGTGTSPGRRVGQVVVMDGRELGARVDGKVIVAVSTDPGWAYLLSGAGAIVAERGSLLSHTAIISRELGIPAVVGVREATTQLRTGDVVEVDGAQGTVRIVERCGEA